MVHVETVLGPISPDKLGITLTHEHIFLELTKSLEKHHKDKMEDLGAVQRSLMYKPVSMDMLGALRRGDFRSFDNQELNDVDFAVKELKEFKRCGGGTIVSVTTPDLGRDPLSLRKVSVETGLNIVVSTGWYGKFSHPSYIEKATVEELRDMMLKELTIGIGLTGIKAGLIKMAAYDPAPYHPDEKKVLEAAVHAQKNTGVGFTIHPSGTDEKRFKVKPAETYLDHIDEIGAKKEKFYLSHSDWTCHDLDYHRRLLERGVSLNYDTFGMEMYSARSFGNRPGSRTPNDSERVDAVVELCGQGYDRQIMLSHDTCTKLQMKAYGGYGYSHVLEHIVPELMDKGVTKKQIDNMLIENPKRILQQ